MNINDVFPTNYLKATDLHGRTVALTIRDVVIESIGDNQSKPVIYFMGHDKGLVLNKTNAMTIQAAFGPNTDAWAGKAIMLFGTKVSFQGQMVDAIRVSPQAQPMQAGAPQTAVAWAPPNQAAPPPDLDEDIPF